MVNFQKRRSFHIVIPKENIIISRTELTSPQFWAKVFHTFLISEDLAFLFQPYGQRREITIAYNKGTYVDICHPAVQPFKVLTGTAQTGVNTSGTNVGANPPARPSSSTFPFLQRPVCYLNYCDTQSQWSTVVCLLAVNYVCPLTCLGPLCSAL